MERQKIRTKMLKVIKKTSNDQFVGLDKVYEECIDYVRDRLEVDIYDREDTNIAKDMSDAFNLLNSIMITNLRETPVFFDLLNNNTIPVEERKQLAQLTFNQCMRGLVFGFEEAILSEIQEVTTH
jgi:actin-like ATPase involved in cell morphogenesis